MGNTEQFNQMASHYDSPERKRVAKLSADAIRESIQNSKEKDALDFGCGTGLVGLELLEDFHSLTFMDSSENMIQQVEKKLSTVENHKANTVCLDLEVERVPEEKGDVVFMSHVLLHIKDTKKILEKLWLLLKDKGQLILVDFDKNEFIQSELVHNGFDQEALSALLSIIGFQMIHSRTFYEDENLFTGKQASLFVLSAEK